VGTAGDDSSSSCHLRFDPPGVFRGDGDSTCAWREGEGVQSESQHTRGVNVIPIQIIAQAVSGLGGEFKYPESFQTRVRIQRQSIFSFPGL
jgi:hypothetical protein